MARSCRSPPCGAAVRFSDDRRGCPYRGDRRNGAPPPTRLLGLPASHPRASRSSIEPALRREAARAYPTYGDRPNTRTRDLIDLLMLVEDGLRPTSELHASVKHVFTVRGAHQFPVDIPDPPPDWIMTYPDLAADLDLEAKTIDHAMMDFCATSGRRPLQRRRFECPSARSPPLPTSPQAKLSGVIKTARDTMRKDAGLNGDIDRIPQLAWLLFLKAFDGLEQRREIVEGRSFRPAIEPAVPLAGLGGRSSGRPHRRGAARVRQRRAAALPAAI